MHAIAVQCSPDGDSELLVTLLTIPCDLSVTFVGWPLLGRVTVQLNVLQLLMICLSVSYYGPNSDLTFFATYKNLKFDYFKVNKQV